MKASIIEQAEENVRKKAARIAYEKSENLKDSDIQTVFFKMYKDCIILGARMMQEELLKLEETHYSDKNSNRKTV